MAYENNPSDYYDPKVQAHVWTSQDFANLGLEDLAYVRTITDEGNVAFVIHAADGTRLASSPDLALAFATVRQNDLDPLRVH